MEVEMAIGIGALILVNVFLVGGYLTKGMNCKKHAVDKKELSQLVIENLRDK